MGMLKATHYIQTTLEASGSMPRSHMSHAGCIVPQSAIVDLDSTQFLIVGVHAACCVYRFFVSHQGQEIPSFTQFRDSLQSSSFKMKFKSFRCTRRNIATGNYDTPAWLQHRKTLCHINFRAIHPA